MAKHTYAVTINRIPASRDPIDYKFRTTMCTLTCSKDAASVCFQMGTKKEFDDLISFRVDLVKDALRKMYLLHAMKYDSRLRVRTITVTIDGGSKVYDQTCPGFPFLYSMLTAKELGLTDAWREPGFLRTVLAPPKSKTDNDHRYAALFSFLAGTGKAYEIEKFTCYWTALNGCYNHLMARYKDACAAGLGYETYEDLPRSRRLKEGDATSISALMRVLGCGEVLSPQSDRTKHFKSQYGAMKSFLRGYSREDLRELYGQMLAHRQDLAWVPEGPLGDHLRQCMARTGMSAWSFVVLEYAYYMRCNYLHASKATILFTAAGDPEIAAFRALNVFLGEYLKELIPQMFREGWFTQQMYRDIKRGITSR